MKMEVTGFSEAVMPIYPYYTVLHPVRGHIIQNLSVVIFNKYTLISNAQLKRAQFA
jgi:hypothetical protein